MKDISSIFTSIANQSKYNEIRKRYKIHHLIKLGLSKTHLNFIVFVAYKNNILTIMATNHIGQMELNYQKQSLLKHLKRYKDFKDITNISILRYDKEKRKNNMVEFDFLSKKENQKKYIDTFDEKSYGIFENNITDEKLYKQMEDIRKLIKNNDKIK